MSIRTTVTLEDDVISRLKAESKERGVSFKTFINETIRAGLLAMQTTPPRKPYRIKPVNLGVKPGINYDNIGELLEQAEGEDWR